MEVSSGPFGLITVFKVKHSTFVLQVHPTFQAQSHRRKLAPKKIPTALSPSPKNQESAVNAEKKVTRLSFDLIRIKLLEVLFRPQRSQQEELSERKQRGRFRFLIRTIHQPFLSQILIEEKSLSFQDPAQTCRVTLF